LPSDASVRQCEYTRSVFDGFHLLAELVGKVL
jgi:hypothetical protein